MALVLALSMIVMQARGAQGQGPAVKAVQFRAALKCVSSNSAEWQKAINDVDVESLPVPYKIGKIYEKNNTLLNQDLQVVVLWAQRIEHEDSLYGDVNFLSAIQELQNQLQQFATLLLDAEISDPLMRGKVTTWSDTLATHANTTVNDIYQTTIAYTTDHALRMDQMCLQSRPESQQSQ